MLPPNKIELSSDDIALLKAMERIQHRKSGYNQFRSSFSVDKIPKIIDINKPTLVVSGSRYINQSVAKEIAELTVWYAQNHGMQIFVGDAIGFDRLIHNSFSSDCSEPSFVFFTNKGLRIPSAALKPHVIPINIDTYEFSDRDWIMLKIASLTPQNKFVGCWNGKSLGTVSNMNLAESLGIHGILFSDKPETTLSKKAIYKW